MDEREKVRFKRLLSEQFNDNLKSLNDALDKHIQSIIYKKEFNKKAYAKHKENEEFKQKKKDYDKKYYEEHKELLLTQRKQKYHNDNDFKEQMKLKQRNRYLELNKSKNLNPNSSGSVFCSGGSNENI